LRFATVPRLLGSAGRATAFADFLTTDLRTALPALGEGFNFIFAGLVFRALCARALPAGDRLVAGFSRVDFATACLREEGRAPDWRDEREESFFPPFSIELLIRKSPHF
jgi:hypothetical protein